MSCLKRKCEVGCAPSHCSTIYIFKVSGPCIETSCGFLCIKNIANTEMWV